MTQMPETTPETSRSAQAWVRILARYRDPHLGRSLFEIAVTLGPFLLLWALAWSALSVHWSLALALSLINGLFLVRLFAIQHDCGHRAFFRNAQLGDWIGRALGVLTLTPYDVWRKAHAVHHSNAGNLSRRGIGDVMTLTVQEYRARTPLGRLRYRLYRHPLVLFGLGPAYLFLLENRLPLGFMRAGWQYWVSSMGTNIALVALLAGIIAVGGLMPVLLVFVPTTLVAATIGVWLFYIQHQFEETHWDHSADWQVHDAALHGSSHYVMPAWLQWITANLGVHHVHHLYSRVPFYRLPEVLEDHAELAQAQRLTIRQSLACVNRKLWDEGERRLLSFKQARALA